MRLTDLQLLPRLSDGLTFLYVDRARIEQDQHAIAWMARETGIAWHGRSYSSEEWTSATPVNRALSTANACLYGICHAAVVSLGFSPGLGFVHTGKSLAFVYDVADLYKVDVTIPLSFRCAAGPLDGLESRVRKACRDSFRATKLLTRIVPDIQRALGLRPELTNLVDLGDDEDSGALWGPDQDVPGGVNYADEDEP